MRTVKFGLIALLFTFLLLGAGPIKVVEALKAVATPAAEANKAPVTDNLKDLFVDLSRRLVPSVVNIYTTQTISNPYGTGQQGELYKRFFEQFFGEEMPQNALPQARKATSLGTGFIIDEKEGLILTNYHVVADSDEIKIILTEEDADRDGIDAKVVGGDSEADVALLKIKTNKKLKAAPFGDSDALQVGEWVMAVGNPFGHGHTVTKGIVSAKERFVPIAKYSNYIQTDAPINPGNSGGPLINTAGQVIGINAAINAAAQGIGFAIPINYVKKILPDLRTKGVVTRGFLGVNVTEINPQLAKYLKLKKDTRGVIVSEIFEGEPAAKAGVQVYDVIYELGGKKITDARQLVNTVSTFAPGATVPMKVLRSGAEKELSVVIGKRPATREASLNHRAGPKNEGPDKPVVKIGMGVEELDTELRRELAIPANVQGVVVTRVQSGGPAEEAGLERGDVIVDVDQKPTANLRSFYSVFKEERVYLIRFRRGDGIAITSMDLTKKKNAKPGNNLEE